MTRTFGLPVAVIVGVLLPAFAYSDVAGLFPDPHRVTADYPPEAQRYAAFDVLYRALSRDVPRPQSRLAYDRGNAYSQADIGIDNMHMRNGVRSPENLQWTAERDRLLNDGAFRSSVLAKYRLSGLPPLGVPPTLPPAGPAGRSGPGIATNDGSHAPPLTDQQILDRAFRRALPVTLPSLAGMFLVPWLMIMRSGKRRSPKSVPPTIDPRLPPLPQSLRVVDLGPVRYPIDTRSALVLDVKTTYIARTVYFIQQQPLANPGAYPGTYPPSQTVSSRTDLIRCDNARVRTTRGNEDSWTLYGDGFEVFPGQTISVVLGPRNDDRLDILLAYNHNTGYLGPQWDAMTDAHRARGLFAQTVSFFTGLLGCTALVAYGVADGIANLVQVSMDYLQVMLVPGGICALTIAFFWTRWLKYSVPKGRNLRFVKQYGAMFRGYFEQCTPILNGIFGR